MLETDRDTSKRLRVVEVPVALDEIGVGTPVAVLGEEAFPSKFVELAHRGYDSVTRGEQSQRHASDYSAGVPSCRSPNRSGSPDSHVCLQRSPQLRARRA